MTKFVYIYRIKTTFEYAMGNILEVEAAYNAFKHESELKRLRIVNKSVFGRLLQSTISDCKRRKRRISGRFQYPLDFSFAVKTVKNQILHVATWLKKALILQFNLL